MNNVVFKIYTDLYMIDLISQIAIINVEIKNHFPIYLTKKDAEKKIEEIMKNKESVLTDEEINTDSLYLRYSIYRRVDNARDLELEEEINRTIYSRYIEIINTKKLNI